ncbi:MAG: efflux RND transporter periplasmic adaptor subunit [Bacteroides sp.]|nr:efflux RND transporter periplasmic adaptor subunit [Bacteroides sp.]
MKRISYLLLPLLLLLAGCSGKENKEKDEKEEIPVVRIAHVSEQDVEQNATFTASVEPDQINNISAAMANRIKAIYVDEGMRVAAGQKLVLLDDVNTQSYEAQVDNARAALQLAETNRDRAKELVEIGGGTRQNLDQMEIQVVNARNALSTAERALRNARENTLLTAPVGGVVTARNYDPGDMTGAQPILTIARVRPVKVVINVSESDFSRIHKGMPARLTFQSYGEEEFIGHVSLISPTIDPQSRTFGVEILYPNADERILPGMFGRATLDLGTERRVVVPDKAIVKQPGSGNNFVYVYADGKVSYNKVELGQRLGENYELLSGVPADAEVVVAGQNALRDGERVKVHND